MGASFQGMQPGSACGHVLGETAPCPALRWADMEDDDEPNVPVKVSLASSLPSPFRCSRLIIVNLDNNAREAIMFNSNNTVSWLSEQSFQKFSIPHNAQKLIFYGVELNNEEKTLHRCNMVDN